MNKEYENYLAELALQGGAQGLAAQEQLEKLRGPNIIKEEERDERGRWTSGGGSESSSFDHEKASRMASGIRDMYTQGETFKSIAERHSELQQMHEGRAKELSNLGVKAEDAGDSKKAEAYYTLASEHENAAALHENAADWATQASKSTGSEDEVFASWGEQDASQAQDATDAAANASFDASQAEKSFQFK